MLSRRLPLASLVRSSFFVTTRSKHVSASSSSSRSIAVIGSGIAGLTLTLHLARRLLPGGKHRIVLYDADQRAGGWVRSDRVSLKGKEKSTAGKEAVALVEAGPRSLRPAGLPGLAMLDLIKSLSLSNDLICVPKSHPSAKNRFLYYAGKIHLLPSSLLKALRVLLLDRSHPLSKGKVPSTVLRGLFKKRQERPEGQRWADESIESFLTRRLGKSKATSLPLLDYVGSAVLHGIYAADASQLSVRSIFGFLWNADLVHGSPARAVLPSFLNSQHTPMNKLAEGQGDANANAKLELIKEKRLEKETTELKERLGPDYVKEMESVSVISFPDGVQTLTDAIMAECKKRGVQVELGSKVESITVNNNNVEIKAPSISDTFDRVVLAQPSSSLEATLKGTTLPNLIHNPSSTVAVLNLAMPSSLAIQVPPGFGYLVPRACAKEGDNPMGLLGVVFDSVAIPGQDECSKMTMMFGGPFWKQGYKVHDVLSLKDKEDDFIDRALSLLAKHLSLDESLLKSKVVYKRITLQRNCIVTYSPGHLGRMNQLDQALQKQNRLTVIGASYTGVSLNDCVLYATRTANRLIQSELDETNHHGSVTGLEELVRE